MNKVDELIKEALEEIKSMGMGNEEVKELYKQTEKFLMSAKNKKLLGDNMSNIFKEKNATRTTKTNITY